MNARQPINSNHRSNEPKLLNATFNQDQSCFAVCHENGFRVYSTDPMELRMKRHFKSSDGNNGIGIVSMLYRTNYVALVGGGKHPRFPVNKLCIWDDLKKKPSIFLEFLSPLLNVLLSRVRIVGVIKNQVAVYVFESKPKLLSLYDTCSNPYGCCDLSIGESSSILAFPGRSIGQIQLVDISPENQGKNLVSIVKAHKASIRCLCLSNSGRLIASASETGTIIRIHDTSNCALAYEFRRGLDKATITSMRFSPNDSRLAVLSDKNTLHVFDLNPDKSNTTNQPTGVRLLGKLPLLPKYFKATWSFASANVNRHHYSKDLTDTGVIGWCDNDSIVILWKFKGIWEKYSLVLETGEKDAATTIVDDRTKQTHYQLVKCGWRSLGTF